MSKEKLFQIYEAMADLTLSNLNEAKESDSKLEKEDIKTAFSVLDFYKNIISL